MVWRSGKGGRGEGSYEDNERYDVENKAGVVDGWDADGWESDDERDAGRRVVSLRQNRMGSPDAGGRVRWRVPLLLINAVGFFLLCLGALHIDLGVSGVFLLLLVVNADYVWRQVHDALVDLVG